MGVDPLKITMWCRIFASTDNPLSPPLLLAALREHGLSADGDFHGDAQGWFRAELQLAGQPVHVERYLASEDGIRAELNAWAAWVELFESYPERAELMQRLISSPQIITLQSTPAALETCRRFCQCVARLTEGIYQIDQQGLYAADGRLLLAE